MKIQVKDPPRVEVDLRVQNLLIYLKRYLVIFVFRTLKSFPGCLSLTSGYDFAKSVNYPKGNNRKMESPYWRLSNTASLGEESREIVTETT